MEDGAVSVAGLVLGVAASTSSTQIVLLAGAAGAIADAAALGSVIIGPLVTQ